MRGKVWKVCVEQDLRDLPGNLLVSKQSAYTGWFPNNMHINIQGGFQTFCIYKVISKQSSFIYSEWFPIILHIQVGYKKKLRLPLYRVVKTISVYGHIKGDFSIIPSILANKSVACKPVIMLDVYATQ